MLTRLLIVLVAISTVSASIQKWYVKNNNSSTYCIIANADPEFKMNFTSSGGTTYNFTVEKTVRFSGDCNTTRNVTVNGQNVIQSAQLLTVFFVLPNVEVPYTGEWMLNLYFGKNETIGAFQLIDYDLLTASNPAMNSSVPLNKAANATNDINAKKSQDAYRCSSTVLALDHGSSIVLNKFHVIAEALSGKNEFPNEQVFENCAADAQTSDVVPIIVGACLAGLVVIVLVAYLIGRARAKRQGYASV